MLPKFVQSILYPTVEHSEIKLAGQNIHIVALFQQALYSVMVAAVNIDSAVVCTIKCAQ